MNQNIDVHKSGFIIYTIKYKECVTFYKEVLGLSILYSKESLTCFDFYGSYLMVEIDDSVTRNTDHSMGRDRTCIRLNVKEVKTACKALDEHNVPYDYGEHNWGTIAKFRDPDGNLIGFRSAKEFITDERDGHTVDK